MDTQEDIDMKHLLQVTKPIQEAIAQSPLTNIQPQPKQTWMQGSSLFDKVTPSDKEKLLQLQEPQTREGLLLRRCVGSMMGMVVADALGANFEFLPVRDWSPNQKRPTDPKAPYFEYPSKEKRGGVFYNPFNTFKLKVGQWTDDASMGFCMADSLLSKGEYDGSNMRVWFWNWWANGMNNAFRHDEERRAMQIIYGTLSVGLGGNISKSLNEVSVFTRQQKPAPPRCTLQNEDAGNGSIMRLAPIPIRYHTDIELAMERAYESSFTTHPGPLAAEACSFLAYLIVRCIHRKGKEETLGAGAFLEVVVGEYLKRIDQSEDRAKRVMRKLLKSEEKDKSNERCWNWRAKELGVEITLKNRGNRYNGYPVSPEYFGSYSMDGLALALHAFYHTKTFEEAIVYVVNMCGDADSTGSVVGQIAGAFYGEGGIGEAWVEGVRRWEKREAEMRAILLFVDGFRKKE